jgi:sulfide dehydrogenase cytochrome subunit
MRRKSTLALLACLGLSTLPALAADPIEALARTCNNCHGVNGVSAGPSMPSIGGQSEAYLKQVMMQWKSGERASATMTRLIKGYSDEQIAGLAKYFAAKPWVPVAQKVSANALKTGKEVTERCETCHGETGSKPDDELTPKMHGQWAQYLELELMKYRDDGFQMAHKKMKNTARKLDEAGVATAAQYYAGQNK